MSEQRELVLRVVRQHRPRPSQMYELINGPVIMGDMEIRDVLAELLEEGVIVFSPDRHIEERER